MSDSLHITPVPRASLPTLPAVLSYDEHRGQETPLIIDNGSTTLRFGFCTSAVPQCQPNAVSKYKERKTNKPLLLFGDGIDIEGGAKSQARTPWEGDVLLNFDALENALDYAFIHLGIDAESVEHPVLMTERLCSPLHSRSLTTELMFEQYRVPSVAYCVDSVMSFYHNNRPSAPAPFAADGLVVSFNSASTSVVPVMGGRGLMSHAKRIPWGANQATDYLLKLIQLKYPTFPTRVTATQTNWMLQNFCEFAADYPARLRALKDPLGLRAAERIVQFPYAAPTAEEKTEEELARIAERKREQGRKLQEIAAKTRMEKLVQKENDFQYLLGLRERREEESKKEWANTLQEEGFEDDDELDNAIKKLEGDLKKTRKKETNEDEMDEPPSFPLLDVPDADLDEDGLKEKRKQRLLKAGYEARERAKREKEREREEREAVERREEEERDRDLTGWASKLRKEQETIMNKIKERNRRKVALSDRKSAAAQARMKSIANLAADDRVSKKRRKASGVEDMFGADDADWAIYRKINTAAPSSDEEEDLANLQTVEQKLLQYDPSFTTEHTHAALSAQRSALLSAFRPQYDDGDAEGKARIHLNVERWRVCETWFSPNMAGVDSAGLGEVLQSVLSRFPDQEKGRLVKNVFVTGGPSQLPGLLPRLQATLRPILPPEMPLEIVRAADPFLDTWKGMAAFAKTDEFKRVGVTREEYEEYGGERIKRWWGGNWNSSVPIVDAEE
ncbi:chromatin remodeling complex subunit [Wolfiporia cocos MD-104 SS10]|uniref:Chromatin remodeling complex subunit n=1 Tax=Wolfiporia cocos (strain MD-104) TaxID=742152 RepID=A0A2H3J8Q1_WOLCO|nr:chromatin remodeling complex subunit [Wolfiporia cocos MD-104 SS10]